MGSPDSPDRCVRITSRFPDLSGRKVGSFLGCPGLRGELRSQPLSIGSQARSVSTANGLEIRHPLEHPSVAAGHLTPRGAQKPAPTTPDVEDRMAKLVGEHRLSDLDRHATTQRDLIDHHQVATRGEGVENAADVRSAVKGRRAVEMPEPHLEGHVRELRERPLDQLTHDLLGLRKRRKDPTAAGVCDHDMLNVRLFDRVHLRPSTTGIRCTIANDIGGFGPPRSNTSGETDEGIHDHGSIIAGLPPGLWTARPAPTRLRSDPTWSRALSHIVCRCLRSRAGAERCRVLRHGESPGSRFRASSIGVVLASRKRHAKRRLRQGNPRGQGRTPRR